MIVYEYPLNEQIRTFLRLRKLFERFNFFVSKTEMADHHAALQHLFEILEATTRGDVKMDLIQALSRQVQQLRGFINNPLVDQGFLQETLNHLERSISALSQMKGKLGDKLRTQDWLYTIKLRSTIPGGMTDFDLPSYHFWLGQEPAVRTRDLSEWYGDFRPISEGIELLYGLMVQSGKTHSGVAYQGSFQQEKLGLDIKLLRVVIQEPHHVYPEISASKYMLSMRFLCFDWKVGMVQTNESVIFQLTLIGF